jgi:leader peptidase (prepilin peptidase)/N-methyltransferase
MLLFEIFAGLWFFAFGAVIGSFLNVVVWRTPRGESIVGPSRCPKCGTAIRWYNNVPVFGWIWLGGKCRDCKLPISPRYPIVEFICGAMFLAVALAELATPAPVTGNSWRESGFVSTLLDPHWPRIATYALHMLLLSMLLAWGLMQVDEQQIPNGQIAGLWLVGLVTAAVLPSLRTPIVTGTTGAVAISHAWRGVIRALSGFAIGAGVAFPVALVTWFLRRLPTPRVADCAIIVAMASVGLILGPEAVIAVTVVALALRGLSLLVGLFFTPLQQVPLMMEIFVATLVHICLAERLGFMHL